MAQHRRQVRMGRALPRQAARQVRGGTVPRGRQVAVRGQGGRQAARQRGRGGRGAQRGDRLRRYRRPGGRFGRQRLEAGARSRLQRFRQASLLAVAITGLFLILWEPLEAVQAQAPFGPADTEETTGETTGAGGAASGAAAASEVGEESADTEEGAEGDLPGAGAEVPGADVEIPTDPAQSVEQAADTVRDLLLGFYGILPRLVLAALLILIAAGVGNVVRAILRRVLGRWERAEAIAALSRVIIYVVAIGAALSVIAGDARALVGSVGLAGLALSWALQTPIESFTGWLLNSFRGYYRVGDRIEVGEVFGDVYRIDILTTTVWEAGGPGKPVAGAQPTGALVTFPNWEVLRSNIVNYSSDFPFVWDEIVVQVANESDLSYAKAVLERVAQAVFGQEMAEAASAYRGLLERARLAFDVADEPQVFVSNNEGWTDFTIRYLVDARQRRRWSSDLTLAVSAELAKKEHAGRIIDGFPPRTVWLRDADAEAADEA